MKICEDMEIVVYKSLKNKTLLKKKQNTGNGISSMHFSDLCIISDSQERANIKLENKVNDTQIPPWGSEGYQFSHFHLGFVLLDIILYVWVCVMCILQNGMKTWINYTGKTQELVVV